MNPLSSVYGRVAGWRRGWYERHPHARRRLNQPVISIGNLVVGGSGKTPVVATVARMLRDAGERPAILSRGYARPERIPGVLVVSDGSRVLEPTERSGDEPQMLARSVTGVPVLVATKRYLAGLVAGQQLGCTVMVLDDGFQHFQLERDIDLLMVSPDDLREQVLPSGALREPLDAARVAHALLVTGSMDDARLVALSLGVSDVFTVAARFDAPRLVVPVAAPLDSSGRRRVVSVCGIARPVRFTDALRAQGWEVVRSLVFPDHHWFTAKEMADAASAAHELGADLVMTTEKDAMRLKDPTGVRALGLPAHARGDRAGRGLCGVDLRASRGRARRPCPHGRRRIGCRAAMTPAGSRPRRWQHACEYVLVLAVAALVTKLPMRIVRSCGERLGHLAYHLSASRRRIALENLAHAFPERTQAERDAIARGVFAHFGRLLLELLKFGSLSNEEILELTETRGEANVLDAYAQGRGVMFFTGHFGYWEMSGIAHALCWRPMAVIARPLDNPRLHDMLERIRTRTGNMVIYREGSVRKILRQLADNRGIAILIDQHLHTADAVHVDFFRRSAATTSALAALALRTGAVVIPVATLPREGGRYTFVYGPAIEPPTGEGPEAIRELTQRCTSALEAYITEHPDLWLWMHRRWREAPGTPAAPASGDAPVHHDDTGRLMSGEPDA